MNKKDYLNKYKYDEMRKFLDEQDHSYHFDSVSEEPNESEQKNFETKLENFLGVNNNNKRAILGIDIYKYSKYEPQQQVMIPFVFQDLKKLTESAFFQCESFFSYRYQKDEDGDRFIDTGDGGFIVFLYPIDAVIFAMIFNAYVHLFNSFHIYPKLRKFLGPVTIRYSISYDVLYKIDGNFYGPAIIKSARVMSRDRLNRFLIDEKTYEWFLLNTNGIDNLPFVKKSDLSHLNKNVSKDEFSTKALDDKVTGGGIRAVFCQKLEKILVKDDGFDIYNLTIQSLCSFGGEDEKSISVISTIGNMNCSGI